MDVVKHQLPANPLTRRIPFFNLGDIYESKALAFSSSVPGHNLLLIDSRVKQGLLMLLSPLLLLLQEKSSAIRLDFEHVSWLISCLGFMCCLFDGVCFEIS